MKTVGELRRANLEVLIEELGTLEKLAVAAQSSSVYLSQVRNQAIDRKTGEHRELGARMARRLEIACGKGRGWMDTEHYARATSAHARAGVTSVMSPSGVYEIASKWPFKNIAEARWLTLPASERQRIETFADATMQAWEARVALGNDKQA